MNNLVLPGILLSALVLPGCIGIGIVGSTRGERKLNDVFFGVHQPIDTQTVVDR